MASVKICIRNTLIAYFWYFVFMHIFFQLYHNQSSFVNCIPFFPPKVFFDNFFPYLSLLYISVIIMIIYHEVKSAEILERQLRQVNLANHCSFFYLLFLSFLQ